MIALLLVSGLLLSQPEPVSDPARPEVRIGTTDYTLSWDAPRGRQSRTIQASCEYLRPALHRLKLGGDKSRTLTIRASKRTSYQRVIGVMDCAREFYPDLGFATR
ncbi:MAG: biopolymer transport protein ExbD [Myxococcota bacterium]|jgi:biopolymer transport protein ExbD